MIDLSHVINSIMEIYMYYAFGTRIEQGCNMNSANFQNEPKCDSIFPYISPHELLFTMGYLRNYS